MRNVWAWVCRAARAYWVLVMEPDTAEELLERQTAP
jgi:hypothetical protein